MRVSTPVAFRICTVGVILMLGGFLLISQKNPVTSGQYVYSSKHSAHHIKPDKKDMKKPLNLVKSSTNVTILNKENKNIGGSNVNQVESVNNQVEDEEWLAAKNQLIEGMLPPDVHYMWCGERWFEFKHYLSFISVMKTINPDKVTIHYNYYPQTDKNLYNLWIEDLKHDYQFLIFEKMSKDLEDYCRSDRNTQVNLILKMLNHEGGMYISENTWLINLTPENRLVDFEFSLEPNSMDGYILLRAGIFNNKSDISQLNSQRNLKKNHSGCSPIHQLYHSVPTKCYIVKGGKFNRFWPMDIWELEDPFGRLARKLFYGSELIKKPKPTYDTLVPNIGHMVWIGGGKMDFVFYLSLLSMLFVAKVDVVYIHGDQPPTGPYWASLQTVPRIRSRIKCIRRTPPSMVYQGTIEPWYRALMSDIIRVDLMIKYGGVYTDTDAIWVKPLTREERGYEAVACFDWVDWSYPYPDSVNFGVSYGKKNAPFWRYFRESMRVLHNEVHGFTGVMNPYRILEKNPELIRIDKRLSVICYYSRCHPIWVKDYHNMTNDHVNTNSIPNWREDVHAFHWTYPNPVEYSNRTMLMQSSGLFAEIGKFVLKSAGLL